MSGRAGKPDGPDLGGAIVVKGPGRSWGIVHFGPEPGVCSVDVNGCGYCIGVPCRLPAATVKPEEKTVVNHQVVDLHPATAITVNGHEPRIVHNVTTSTMRMACDTCNWLSKDYKGRWRDKVEESWRDHAADVGMGVTLAHGQVGNGCHCASCAMATRRENEAAHA